ncbi:DUF4139 domain-containing protein [Pulveribacter suum]|uniref:Mucoidy inhibitor MuiA family protein n=1 Tax=Pulveribacter suum TaxID=2116657 RepID=A0A2P1NHG0_9BURK|nr:DUF4139 domain-containing protein [Pulveribacter suum]AVP56478.1 hypothetical protein C7H73_01510 [Pulveribacter suum]
MTCLPIHRLAVLPLLLACVPGAALAQGAAPLASRISTVTLYPGSATVERTARVAAGSRAVVFDCLPQGLDARSVQVQAASGAVRVGDIAVQLRERALAPGCAGPQDERLRALEQRLAEARAETGALELAHSYLQSIAGSAPGTSPVTGPGTPGAGQIGATTEALRKSGQETLVRLHQARARQDELERQAQALAAERGAGARARVASVTVALAAEQGAELRLSYQVRGPSWSPSYRATLETAAASPAVRLERLALVAQDTGEDWSGAALTLSTGQPLRTTGAPLPRPWTVDVRPDPPVPQPPRAMAPAPAMAARSEAAPAEAAVESEPLPDFTVAVTEGAYATEFAVPQRVNVPSGGPKVALALQAQQLGASLITRTTPALDATAYLVARLAQLPGVWPTGPVALYRGAAYVGQGVLDTSQPEQELPFGRDERVAVTAEPERRASASAGLTGARTERTTERSYVVTNRHPQPVQLQVLDAAPVPLDAQIKVESHYEPAPQDTAWRAQPGTIAWSQPLAAGASARFTARHTLRHDRELRLREQR